MNSSANYFGTEEKRPISTFITHQSGDHSACTPLTTCRRWTSIFFIMQHTTHDTDLDCFGTQDQQREALQKRHRYLPPITINPVNRFALHYVRAHNRYSKRSTLTSVLSSHGDETKRKRKKMMKINYLFIIELNTMQYHLWMWSSERSNIKSKIQEQYAFAHNLIRMKLTKPEITTTTTSFDAQI